MVSFIKKTAIITALGALFLANPALAINPTHKKPTVKSDWKFTDIIKTKNEDNDLLKPGNFERPNLNEQANYEAEVKIEIVPVVQEQIESEMANPTADSDEIAEDSIDSALNSTSDSSSEADSISEDFNSNLPSPKDGGDIVSGDDLGTDSSVEDGSLQDVTYTEGTSKPNNSGLKLPEFDSLFGYLGETTEAEETVPSDPDDEVAPVFYDDAEAVSAELDVATTTVKAKIVLQYTVGTFVDGTLSADILKDGAVVTSSNSVSFNPSETVTGKGTLVVEFESTENLSHDDFDTLELKTTDTFTATVVSYAVSIYKKVKLEDTVISASSAILPLSFLTDTSEPGLSSAPSYTTTVKVNHVLQYSEGETYVDGSLDVALYNADSVALDFGTGEKSFNESSTVEGKGIFTTTFASTWDISFNKITEVELKTDGSVLAELLNYSVEIEKKVKPSDTTFTATEESNTLSLPVF